MQKDKSEKTSSDKQEIIDLIKEVRFEEGLLYKENFIKEDVVRRLIGICQRGRNMNNRGNENAT